MYRHLEALSEEKGLVMTASRGASPGGMKEEVQEQEEEPSLEQCRAMLSPVLGREGFSSTRLDKMSYDELVCTICLGLFDPEVRPNVLSAVDSRVTIVIGGGRCVRQIFFAPSSSSSSASSSRPQQQQAIFPRLSSTLQLKLLDLLRRALQDSIYNVVRFCCNASEEVEGQEVEGDGLLHKLLDLLPLVQQSRPPEVAMGVMKLIGIIGRAGIEAKDLKRILRLLRHPPSSSPTSSRLTRSILQALQNIVRQDTSTSPTKANPATFFSLGGGTTSGLIIPRMPTWPFPYAYQFLVWFRVERFPSLDMEGGAADGGGGGIAGQKAHLVAFLTQEGHGIDVYLSSQGRLYLQITDRRRSRGNLEVIETIPIENVELQPRVWYFLDVQHTRAARMSFMGKDTMTVQIDQHAVYRGSPRFPKNITSPLEICSIGEGLDGQLAPIYILTEPLPTSTTSIIARYHAASYKATAIDLDPMPHLGLSTKSLSSKLLLVYHPDRCRSKLCLDLHGGWHGMMVGATRVWSLDCARDVMASTGGVAALFPLFFLVLIARSHSSSPPPAPSTTTTIITSSTTTSSSSSSSASSATTSTSTATTPTSTTTGSSSSSSSSSAISISASASSVSPPFIEQQQQQHEGGEEREGERQGEEEEEEEEGGYLALLLSILAHMLRSHEVNQKEMYRIGGVEMLEHVISRTSPTLLAQEKPFLQAWLQAVMDLCTITSSTSPSTSSISTSTSFVPSSNSSIPPLPSSSASCHPFSTISNSSYLPLEHHLIRRLLSPALWSHAPIEFQISLQQAQGAFIRRNPSQARDLLSVGVFLDAIRDHFSPYLPPSQQEGSSNEQQSSLVPTSSTSSTAGETTPIQGERWGPGNPSLIRMFRNSSFSQPMLNTSPLEGELDDIIPGHSSNSGDWVMLGASSGGRADPSNGSIGRSTAYIDSRGRGKGKEGYRIESSKDREVIRRIILQNIICLGLDEVTGMELRPMLQFLAAFREGDESDLAEEILQVLLYWFLQEQPPRGLLEAIKSTFVTSQAFVAFLILGVINRDVDHLRSTGIRVLSAFLMRIREEEELGSKGGAVEGAGGGVGGQQQQHRSSSSGSLTSSMNGGGGGNSSVGAASGSGTTGGGGGLASSVSQRQLQLQQQQQKQYQTPSSSSAAGPTGGGNSTTMATTSSNTGNNSSRPIRSTSIPSSSLFPPIQRGPVDHQLSQNNNNTSNISSTSSSSSSGGGGGGGGASFLWHYLQQHVSTIDEHTYASLLETVLASKAKNLGSLPMFSKPMLTSSGVYVPSILQPTKIIDDSDEIQNVTVLTIILKLLPSLAHHLKERAYGDLLLLLKFSERNRMAFVTVAGWQVPLFELMAPFILPTSRRGQQEEASWSIAYDPLLQASPSSSFYGRRRSNGQGRPGEGEGQEEEDEHDWSVDHWIDMGMKLYVLLLMHVLNRTNGWQEIARALSLEQCAPQGRLVLLALCSQLLVDVNTDMRQKVQIRQEQLWHQQRASQNKMPNSSPYPNASSASSFDDSNQERMSGGSPSASASAAANHTTYLTNLTQAAFIMNAFLMGPTTGCCITTLSILGLEPTEEFHALSGREQEEEQKREQQSQQEQRQQQQQRRPSRPPSSSNFAAAAVTTNGTSAEEEGEKEVRAQEDGGAVPATAPGDKDEQGLTSSSSSPSPPIRAGGGLPTTVSIPMPPPLPRPRPPPPVTAPPSPSSFQPPRSTSSRSRRRRPPQPPPLATSISYYSGWAELCNGSGKTTLCRFPSSQTAIFGRKVSEKSGTVLVATQLLQLLDSLWAMNVSSAAGIATTSYAQDDGHQSSSSKEQAGGARHVFPYILSSSLEAIESQQSLAFLAQEGPSSLGPGAGTVATLMLRVSLFVLNTVHSFHPIAMVNACRLKRLIHILSTFGAGGSKSVSSSSSSSSTAVDDWLIIVITHVQNALRRLRHIITTTLASSTIGEPVATNYGGASPSSTPSSPRMSSAATNACPFCPGGELEGVVKEVEDLFEILEGLNRDRAPLVSNCMRSADAYFSLCKMLQSRKMYYMKQRQQQQQRQGQEATQGQQQATTTSRPRRSSALPEPAMHQEEGREDVSSSLAPSPEHDHRHHRASGRRVVSLGDAPIMDHDDSLDHGRSISDEKEEKCKSCYWRPPSSLGGSLSSSFLSSLKTTPTSTPSSSSRQAGVVSRASTPMLDNQDLFPWKLLWLLSPWIDMNLAEHDRVRSAAASLIKREVALGKEHAELLSNCFEQQLAEERLWRTFDPRSSMYMDGRTLKSQLEEVEHQRLASRVASTDLQQRAAINKWATIMRMLSAEWSSWAVEDERSRWKISTHHDMYRRRMLLSRTDKFEDHQDAAYKTGNSAPSGLSSDKNKNGEEGDDADVLLARKSKALRRALSGGGFEGDAGEDGEGGGMHRQESSMSPPISPTRGSTKETPTPPWADEFAPGETWMTAQVAKLVNPYGSVQGKVILTNQSLYFHPDRDVPPPSLTAEQVKGGFTYVWKDKKWRLDRVTEVHGRRHLLRNCALEIYFSDAHEVFFAFPTPKDRGAFHSKLSRQHMPLLITPKLLRPAEILRESRLTEAWKRRQISNFEYLMRLNIIAGRSYNDINQYPVFPWVIANYTSSELDLTNPANFRDLSKPVGALDEKRLQLYLERYDSFDDDLVPKFMYGSHYSSAGLVLHYLMRQEPFTTLAIKLQNGTFDCPDRLFFDILSSWQGCHRSTTDVKELVPELFAVPEILINSNNYPLGHLDERKGPVGDVRLPPWAKNAYDFIRINRLALESENVSQNLHHWIDLIFGYKQRGQAAVEAHNVFYYLTYEGAVDIDAIDDPMLKEATEAQIKHYGQTPSQLLTKPHPARLPPEECVQAICSSPFALKNLRAYTPAHQLSPPASPCPILSVVVLTDRIFAVFADLSVASYRWSSMPDVHDFPFTVRAEKIRQLPCQSVSMSSYAIFDSTVSRVSERPITPLPMDDSLLVMNSGTPSSTATSSSSTVGHHKGAVSSNRSSPDLEEDDGDAVIIMTPQREQVDDEGVGDGLRSMGPWNFALCGDRIISCGFWDHTIKCYGLDGMKLQANTNGGHRGPINCLQIGDDGRTLVTGGQDGTCRVWVADNGGIAAALRTESAYLSSSSDHVKGSSGRLGGQRVDPETQALQCVSILWGHETAVISIFLSTKLDLLASGSVDGTIVLHQVRKGKYIRRMTYPNGHAVNLMHLSQQSGDLVVHSWKDCSLHSFSLNGFHLASTQVRQRLYAMTVTLDGQLLVAGGKQGHMLIYLVHSLEQVHDLAIGNGPIRSLNFTPDHQYILVGSENGRFSVVADPLSRLQMLHRVLSRTFFGVI